jgi:ribonuclease R
MEREAQLLRNRKGSFILPERASLIAGRIEGHPDGYGFLVPDDAGEDLFLEARQMSKVLHGDRALVRVVGVDRRGRREGVIVEVSSGRTAASSAACWSSTASRWSFPRIGASTRTFW